MEIRTKERMDVITEHIRLAKEHKVKLKITDGIYTNFGRSYYRIEFEFLNDDDTRCYHIIPSKNTISWYVYHIDYGFIDDIKVLDGINNDIKKDYEWVTTMVNYFLYHGGKFEFNWRPTLIPIEETRLKGVTV